MKFKLITLITISIALVANVTSAKTKPTAQQLKKEVTKTEKGYRHAPDSTMVHAFPNPRPTTKAPKGGKGYRHAPDSTMVRPKMPNVPSKK